MLRRTSPPLLLAALFMCLHNAHAEVHARAMPILVEADEFHVDLRSEQAVWHGDVRATQGSTTFRATSLTLQLEQIETQDRSSAGSARSGEQGNVYQLSADRVSYDLQTGQILGTGNSELRRGLELIRAQEIVYQVDQQKVQATPAANGRVQVQFLSAPGQTLFPVQLAD